MEIYVYDTLMNRLGILDDHISLKTGEHTTKHGQIQLTLDADENAIKLFKRDQNVIVVLEKDITTGYFINHFEYTDESKTEIFVQGPTLGGIFNRRLIQGQQRQRGLIEQAMKNFVSTNAINPTNPNRVIPNLVLAQDFGIDITVDESCSNKYLDDFLYEMAVKYNVMWDVLVDLEQKQLVFATWQASDRSALQDTNPQIIFSKDNENVLKQSYIENEGDYRNVAVVAGEGEGTIRKYRTVNDELTGLERIELFVDARDIQSTYEVDGTTHTIPEVEYYRLLEERGKSKLAELKKVQAFESEIDLYSQYTFGADYFLGDKVSIINEDLNVALHTTVESVFYSNEKGVENLEINFGSSVPTFFDKVKKAVKQ